jgi:hypothetical protein
VETAKQEAAGVADAAVDAAGGVVDTAKAEAAQVAQEVKLNARELLTQTKGELADQAAIQQQRVADGLRSVSDELSTMAGASQGGGVATDLVRQAAERSSSVASWLESRDPGSLLDEVKGFARRRPGAFLLLAAGAGVLAGRLGRGLAENASDGHSDSMAGAPDAGVPAASAPGAPAAGSYAGTGGAVPPPPVDLPGPQTTTAGYGAMPAAASGSTAAPGYGTAAPEADTAAFPEADTTRVKAQGDPLAGSFDPDSPEYGGPR